MGPSEGVERSEIPAMNCGRPSWGAARIPPCAPSGARGGAARAIRRSRRRDQAAVLQGVLEHAGQSDPLAAGVVAAPPLGAELLWSWPSTSGVISRQCAARAARHPAPPGSRPCARDRGGSGHWAGRARRRQRQAKLAELAGQGAPFARGAVVVAHGASLSRRAAGRSRRDGRKAPAGRAGCGH